MSTSILRPKRLQNEGFWLDTVCTMLSNFHVKYEMLGRSTSWRVETFALVLSSWRPRGSTLARDRFAPGLASVT